MKMHSNFGKSTFYFEKITGNIISLFLKITEHKERFSEERLTPSSALHQVSFTLKLDHFVIYYIYTLTSSRRELYFFRSPRTGLFSVKILKKFLAINIFCCQ